MGQQIRAERARADTAETKVQRCKDDLSQVAAEVDAWKAAAREQEETNYAAMECERVEYVHSALRSFMAQVERTELAGNSALAITLAMSFCRVAEDMLHDNKLESPGLFKNYEPVRNALTWLCGKARYIPRVDTVLEEYVDKDLPTWAECLTPDKTYFDRVAKEDLRDMGHVVDDRFRELLYSDEPEKSSARKVMDEYEATLRTVAFKAGLDESAYERLFKNSGVDWTKPIEIQSSDGTGRIDAVLEAFVDEGSEVHPFFPPNYKRPARGIPTCFVVDGNYYRPDGLRKLYPEASRVVNR
jgi:hypothetical protein